MDNIDDIKAFFSRIRELGYDDEMTIGIDALVTRVIKENSLLLMAVGVAPLRLVAMPLLEDLHGFIQRNPAKAEEVRQLGRESAATFVEVYRKMGIDPLAQPPAKTKAQPNEYSSQPPSLADYFKLHRKPAPDTLAGYICLGCCKPTEPESWVPEKGRCLDCLAKSSHPKEC